MVEQRRTSPVDYSRQEAFSEDMGEVLNSTHVIIGCGGVGFWLGVFLAMNGADRFILIDGDCIEESNLNRLPVPESFVGFNKTHALKRQIRFLRADTQITAIGKHATEDIVLKIIKRLVIDIPSYRRNVKKLILWDTTDDAHFQKKYYRIFKDAHTYHNRLKYRKIGYEGYQIASYAKYNVWVPEEYQTGYQTSRANSITSALSACFGILSQAFNIGEDVVLNIKDIASNKIPVQEPEVVLPEEDPSFADNPEEEGENNLEDDIDSNEPDNQDRFVNTLMPNGRRGWTAVEILANI